MAKTSFDDHLAVITGRTKTASSTANRGQSSSLLQKLAEQLNIEGGATPAAQAAPIIVNANAPVGAAAPAVESATAAIADAQVALAGGDPIAAEAGMEPAATTGDESGVIVTGEGTVKPIDLLGKTPEAATPDAEKLGALIADSFVKHLEKIAKQNEYSAAVGMLKEAGILDGYNIKDAGFEKVAGAPVDYLEKIAQRQKLTHDDIIGAAREYQDFLKVAAETEEAAEKDADDLVEALNQVAEDDDTEDDVAAEAIKDPEVAAAMKVLQDKGLV